MKSVKLAVIAALSSFAVSAFALSPMQDADLSAVSGQDGVNIAANLNIDIGSFVYTDKDGAGALGQGSVTFEKIEIRGGIAAVIDIISAGAATATLTKAGLDSTAAGAFVANSDVVQIALPDIAIGASGLSNTNTDGTLVSKAVTTTGAARKTNNLYFGVQDIKMGGTGGKSFGSFAMNDIKMQGTKILIWAH